MKHLIILVLLVSSTICVAATKSEIEALEEKELETYMNSNYVEEYVPEAQEDLQIVGEKRITLAYFSSMMPTDFGTITDYEFQFGYNLGHYWLEALIGQGSAQFGSVGSNSGAVQAAESEGNFQREDEAKESYVYLGIGASLQSRHLADLLGFNRIYETFHGYMTYHTLSEELRSEDYAGFGARADASINYLLSRSSHLGLKFSFGFSSLKRSEAYEGEVSSQRSLMFRWNRIGVDYSFYF